jgi:hypothetical protein
MLREAQRLAESNGHHRRRLSVGDDPPTAGTRGAANLERPASVVSFAGPKPTMTHR